MANAYYTNPCIHNIGLNEENSLSHLLDHISPEIENETTLIELSKYYNDVEFKNVLQNTNSKISMLSLNCKSINAKFDKLNFFSCRCEHRMSNFSNLYSRIMGSRNGRYVPIFASKLLTDI